MDIFVTGTDTNVGKTIVSAVLIQLLLQKGIKPAYYKPIQTGAIIELDEECSEDVLEVNRLTGLCYSSGKYCSYILENPLSPYQSARNEGKKISLEKIMQDYKKLKDCNEYIIIEGAGGLYVPITDEMHMIDMIEMMGTSVILVVPPGLGTINQSLLSIKALQERNINILGFIVNRYPTEENETQLVRENPEMITKYSGIKCLGRVMESILPILKYKINQDFIL